MKYIIIIALLAVAAGCDTGPTVIEGHEYVRVSAGYNSWQFIHREGCAHPDHKESPAVVDWEDQLKRAAPAGTEITGEIAFESDTLNRHGRLTHYACSNAILSGDRKAYLRLELVEEPNGDLRPTPVLHTHTCLRAGVNCYFLFDHRGYYNGCNCGGDVTVVGLP